MKTEKAEKTEKKVVKREAKISVSESNIAKAALRLLSHRLVSAEVSYVQRVLGATAPQADLDAQVVAVRKMPWSSIVVPD